MCSYMRGAQCKEKSTLGCYIMVNKIFIMRAISLGPRWAPVLVHTGRLPPGLALSSFCWFRRMLVALAYFCPSVFLPDKYPLSTSCASAIGLTCLHNFCFASLNAFSVRIENTGISLLASILPTANPYPAPGAPSVLPCHTWEIQQSDQSIVPLTFHNPPPRPLRPACI